MRSDATIVTTCYGDRVMVTYSNGNQDWPILYEDGRIAFDNPLAVPPSIKKKARKLLEQLEQIEHKEG